MGKTPKNTFWKNYLSLLGLQYIILNYVGQGYTFITPPLIQSRQFFG
jgi:hypothetical protein